VEGRGTRVLINFATLKFYAAQQLNAETALTVGGFDKVICYGARDIDRHFRARNRSILRSRIGAGCWLWKPYFIKRSLDLLSEGDFLFYCDSGIHFVDPVDPLIELAARTQQPIIPFELIHLERRYTKRETLILMGCDAARFTDTRQRLGGFILFQKSAFAEKFVDEFLALAQDPRLITDRKSRLGTDYADFVAHRHDQSIFSLLTKRYGLTAFRDPSQYGNDLREEYPESAYGQLIDLTRSRTSRPAGLALSWWKRLRARHKTGERGLMMRRL
jgi:hypothetical protein